MNAEDLLMIVPTRGRPASVAPLLGAWVKTETRARLLFALDIDDPELDAYRREFECIPAAREVAIYVGPRLRLAGTLNEAVSKNAPYFAAVGFMGDDHRPRTKGWDARFAECLSGGAGIVYGNDLLVGAKFPTAVMMTSDIPRALGYMCPPGFTHLCLDLVWKDWGDGMGRITYLDDVVIEHVHPAAQKAPLDAGYEYANSPEMVSADSAAYFAYRDTGGLSADLVKLKELL